MIRKYFDFQMDDFFLRVGAFFLVGRKLMLAVFNKILTLNC